MPELRVNERLLVMPGPVCRTCADRRLDLAEETLAVAGVELRLLRPRDLDALVGEQASGESELVPYWAEMWPSCRALVDVLPPQLHGRVLEVGCGLGLPSILAASRGAEVTAVDCSPDAVELLSHNAARNGVSLCAEVVDWTRPRWLLQRSPWDLVLASDVLYERRHVAPLLDLLPRLGPEVLLADPGRQPLDDFLEAATDVWEIEDVAGEVVRLLARA